LVELGYGKNGEYSLHGNVVLAVDDFDTGHFTREPNLFTIVKHKTIARSKAEP
jgi:hypothetical protein